MLSTDGRVEDPHGLGFEHFSVILVHDTTDKSNDWPTASRERNYISGNINLYILLYGGIFLALHIFFSCHDNVFSAE
jgi:hypothetical protein